MASQDQYIQIASLPEEVRVQVIEFITFLMRKHNKQDVPGSGSGTNPPIGGLAKGLVIVPKDFDEPLDDLKEYME